MLTRATTGYWLWAGIFAIVFTWSAITPADYEIWFLEVFPAMVGFVLLALTRDRFPLTTLVYVLVLVHCIVLMIGGHYTYAEVPLFNWIRDTFEHSRNNFDKVGHFLQGFVPALVAREVLIRLKVVPSAAWRNFFIVCVCLAISALYELIEWWVALLSEEAADAFLGTQGYAWDTQSDMGWCLYGAILSLLLLSRWHDRQLARIPRS